jgi:hypothetical protein
MDDNNQSIFMQMQRYASATSSNGGGGDGGGADGGGFGANFQQKLGEYVQQLLGSSYISSILMIKGFMEGCNISGCVNLQNLVVKLLPAVEFGVPTPASIFGKSKGR